MGLFDSVFLECKNCGELVEFQSKAVFDSFLRYYPDDPDAYRNYVPYAVRADLDGQTQSCGCGSIIRFEMDKINKIEKDTDESMS